VHRASKSPYKNLIFLHQVRFAPIPIIPPSEEARVLKKFIDYKGIVDFLPCTPVSPPGTLVEFLFSFRTCLLLGNIYFSTSSIFICHLMNDK